MRAKEARASLIVGKSRQPKRQREKMIIALRVDGGFPRQTHDVRRTKIGVVSKGTIIRRNI